MKIMSQELAVRIQEDNPDLTLDQIKRMQKSFVKNVMEAVADGDTVLMRGFGSFNARSLKGHPAVNVHTGEKVIAPSVRRPYFKAGIPFKQLVNGK